MNGYEQQRAMGKDPHLAGQVRHPLPFRSTIAGPQGKSFSQHGPNPADPVKFHVKFNPKLTLISGSSLQNDEY